MLICALQSWGLAFGLEMEMSGRALTPLLVCCDPAEVEVHALKL